MAIRYENVEDIPQDEKDDFVVWEEKDESGNEKKVHLHKDYAESLKTQYRLQGDVTRLETSSKETSDRLKELEAEKDERKRKKEQDELDKKKKDGKFDELLHNAETKLDQQKADYEKKLADKTRESAEREKSTLIRGLSELGTDASRSTLKRVMAADLEIQDDGRIIVLDEDGKATTDTLDEYRNSLAKRYPSLVKAVQSKGGVGKGGDGDDADAGKNKQGKLVDDMVAKVPALKDLPRK